MQLFWPMLAAPAVAVAGAAGLHARPTPIYWAFCSLLTSVIAAPFYYFASMNPAPPFNAPSVLVAVFIVVPTLVTFGIERLWFVLGRAVSRPLATAVLSFRVAVVCFRAVRRDSHRDRCGSSLAITRASLLNPRLQRPAATCALTCWSPGVLRSTSAAAEPPCR